MKLAPIDIAHKSFTRKMMGLDPTEVTDFLRQLSDEMEALIRERNNLREQLREKELQIIEYKERDELLKNTITTATRMSEKMQQDAEREARLIVNDAHQQSEMIVRDARDSLKRIFQEISELKRIRMQFENSVRTLVQSHTQMLDQGRSMMPDPEVNLSPEALFTAAQSINEKSANPAASPKANAPSKAASSPTSSSSLTTKEDIKRNVTEALNKYLDL